MDSGYAIELKALIEKRKSLEKEPKSLNAFLPKEAAPNVEYLNVEDYLRKL